jgi:hypothetical protein
MGSQQLVQKLEMGRLELGIDLVVAVGGLVLVVHGMGIGIGEQYVAVPGLESGSWQVLLGLEHLAGALAQQE